MTDYVKVRVEGGFLKIRFPDGNVTTYSRDGCELQLEANEQEGIYAKVIADSGDKEFPLHVRVSTAFEFLVDDVSTLRLIYPMVEDRRPRGKDCPECWGTGHYKGVGRPCSRGCKPPSAKHGLAAAYAAPSPVVEKPAPTNLVPKPAPARAPANVPTNYMVTLEGIQKRIIIPSDLAAFVEASGRDGLERNIYWEPTELLGVVNNSSGRISFSDSQSNVVLSINVVGVMMKGSPANGHIRVLPRPPARFHQGGKVPGGSAGVLSPLVRHVDYAQLERDVLLYGMAFTDQDGRRIDPTRVQVLNLMGDDVVSFTVDGEDVEGIVHTEAP